VLAAAACGVESTPQIAVVSVPEGQDLITTRREAALAFLAEHDDVYDMLVFFDTANRFNAYVTYLPVANDVRGIGYRHLGLPDEVFDDGGQYGTRRADGLIWFGNRWRTIDVDQGPDSLLAVLAQETGHRWGAMVHHVAAALESDALLSVDRQHWSAFLDAGDSPLGGGRWEDRGGGQFARVPRGDACYGDLDLYLMGLLPADAVAPAPLLVDVSADGCSQGETCAAYWPDSPPEVVQAELVRVGAADIEAAEGPRAPAAGASPTVFRQAWIYVVHGEAEPDAGDLAALERARPLWEDFFRDATRGLAAVDTRL
jgi:hypothetical protein